MKSYENPWSISQKVRAGAAWQCQGMSSVPCPGFMRHPRGANPNSTSCRAGINGIISLLSQIKGCGTLTHSQYGQRSVKRSRTLSKIASRRSLGFVKSGFKGQKDPWPLSGRLSLPKSHKRQKKTKQKTTHWAFNLQKLLVAERPSMDGELPHPWVSCSHN